MADLRIQVTVDENGTVQARRLDNNAQSERGPVRFRGLDAELVRLFERWLTLRDRVWRENEIRTFGSLLHRCLFPDSVWGWIQSAADANRPGRVRLEMVFPAEGSYARMSAVPWEYLYRPERAGRAGSFLAADSGLMLSRYIPSEIGETEFRAQSHLNLLVVISRPADPRLSEVMYEDVLAVIEETAAQLGFSVSVLRDPTASQLHAAIGSRQQRPDLVHFMGHGQFDADRGEASLALVDPGGGTDWVDDRRLSDLFSRQGIAPRAVVLHSCEGGVADFSASFAGLAPQLVRNGVQCVVAMQYPVTNETAIEFSTSLYRGLAAGTDLDAAAQEARWQISRLSLPPDPRLVGVPVVYLQNRRALLAAGADGDDDDAQ